MEDKRKLMAAILGAITAYIQMEQQPAPVTASGKSKTKANRWKISRRERLMKAKRVKR
ncbi:MAG: hypothetical protein OEZ00_07115 [Dehalococcoidia bacterium]|nr:hypothetical protein [Dehalococcoidia bacterium]